MTGHRDQLMELAAGYMAGLLKDEGLGFAVLVFPLEGDRVQVRAASNTTPEDLRAILRGFLAIQDRAAALDMTTREGGTA